MKCITLENLMRINKQICSESNEPFNIINKFNLESALSNYNSYYESEEEIISAIYKSIILNHGFENGNKRTAVACLIYLKEPLCNDYTLFKLTEQIASENGSKIPVSYISQVLYQKEN